MNNYPPGVTDATVSDPIDAAPLFTWADLDDAEIETVRDEFLAEHGRDFLCTLDDVEGSVMKTHAELVAHWRRWQEFKAAYLVRKQRWA